MQGGVTGGIFKVVFDQPTSIDAIRLYRRADCCQDRYNKLSVTLRVSSQYHNLLAKISPRVKTILGENALRRAKVIRSELLIQNQSTHSDFRSTMQKTSLKFNLISMVTILGKLLNLNLNFRLELILK